MNIEEALVELSFHSGRNEKIHDPRWDNGFLSSLRPYRSMELVEENFHKVIECLIALIPYVKENDQLDKNLASDISSIICFGRAWGGHEEGMLRRNDLVTIEEAKKLDDWIDCILYAWTMLLDSVDENLAFEPYNKQYKI